MKYPKVMALLLSEFIDTRVKCLGSQAQTLNPSMGYEYTVDDVKNILYAVNKLESTQTFNKCIGS